MGIVLIWILGFVKHLEARHPKIWWIWDRVDLWRVWRGDHKSNLHIFVLLLHSFAHHICNIGNDGVIEGGIKGSTYAAGIRYFKADPRASMPRMLVGGIEYF